jgi:hypothetical protein
MLPTYARAHALPPVVAVNGVLRRCRIVVTEHTGREHDLPKRLHHLQLLLQLHAVVDDETGHLLKANLVRDDLRNVGGTRV